MKTKSLLLSFFFICIATSSLCAQFTCQSAFSILATGDFLQGGGRWYRYTPPGDGKIILTSCNIGNDFPNVKVFEECGGAEKAPATTTICGINNRANEYTVFGDDQIFIEIKNNGQANQVEFIFIQIGNTCNDPQQISCGDIIEYNTATLKNRAKDYLSCDQGFLNLSGKDKFFRIDITPPADLIVTLNSTQNITKGLLIFQACDTTAFEWPQNCVDADVGMGERQIEIADASGTYYIGVDYVSNNFDILFEKDFTLEVECIRLDCESATEIFCQDSFVDHNFGLHSFVSSYHCENSYTYFDYNFLGGGVSGPENLYYFTLESTSEVTIDLDVLDNGDDFDLLLLNECNENKCIDASFLANDQSEQIIKTLEAGTYWIVVEGWNNSQGHFNLSIDWNCPVNLAPTVCDLGGTFLNRGNEVIGSIESFDFPLAELADASCLTEVVEEINLPVDSLFIDTYIFHHNDEEIDFMELSISTNDPSTLRAVVFGCDCSDPASFDANNFVVSGSCQQLCNSGQGGTAYTNSAGSYTFPSSPPTGYYYLMIVGQQQVDYSVVLFPEGPCQSNLELINCDDVIEGSVGDNQYDRLTTDPDINIYGDCYGGFEDYNGGDVVYQLITNGQNFVDITLEAAESMGVFLFGFACGEDCILYAETLSPDEPALIEDISLSSGLYYIVIDKASAEGADDSFTLTISCNQDVLYPYYFSDDSDCNIDDTTPHQVDFGDLPGTIIGGEHIPVASNISFFYERAPGLEGLVSTNQWNGELMQTLLPYDPIPDGLICGYEIDDPFIIRVKKPDVNGVEQPDFRVTGVYALGPSTYQPGDLSLISDLNQDNTVLPEHLAVFPGHYFVSPFGDNVTIYVSANLDWDAVEQPLVSWLSINPTSGIQAATINVNVNPNPETFTRFDTIVITGDNSPISRQVIIVQPSLCGLVKANASVLNTINCASPTATLSALGSTVDPAISYLWTTNSGGTINNPTSTNPTVNGPGEYILTVSWFPPGLECRLRDTVIVEAIPAPSVQSVSITDVACHGGTDGAITVTATGGLPPFTFEWSNNQNGPAIQNLSVDEYTLTLTDAINCQVIATYEVSSPADLLATFDVVHETSSGLNDGMITALPQGGTPGYTFQWSNNQEGPTISGLTPGQYMVTITDVNMCTFFGSVTVQEGTCTIQSNHDQMPASCENATDGSGTVIVSSPVPTVNITWPDGTNDFTLNNLAPGDYPVTISIPNTTCETVEIITITVEDDIPPTVLTQDATIFLGDNGAGTISVSQINMGSFDNCDNQLQFNLNPSSFNCDQIGSANVVTLSASDDAGNVSTATAMVTVLDNLPPEITCPNSTTTADCTVSYALPDVIDNCDTEIDLTLDEGLPPDVIFPNGITIVTYTATDDDGNSSTCSFSVTVNNQIVAMASVSQVLSCNIASVMLSSMGSSSGPDISILWESLDGHPISGPDTSNPMVTIAGDYVLNITNEISGCLSRDTVTVEEATLPEVTLISKESVSCAGEQTGSLMVETTGGVLPYTYSWSNGESAAAISNLAANTYFVTVTDALGCMTFLTETISEPPSLDLSIEAMMISEPEGNDGTATAEVSGGVPPYTYLWSNNDTTATIIELVAGSYSLVVTDANNCIITGIANITDPICSTLQVADTSIVPASCEDSQDGTATISMEGGSPPYSFVWENNPSTEATATDLSPGIYHVTISDEFNCVMVVVIEMTFDDLIPPNTITQDIQIFLNEAGIAIIAPQLVDGGSTDNCGEVSLLLNQQNFNCDDIGPQQLILTAIDESDNSSTAIASVTVLDTISPVINCSDNIVTTSCLVEYLLPSVLDNCANTTLELMEGITSGTIVEPNTTHDISFQVTDVGNNTTSCSFMVGVVNSLNLTVTGVFHALGPDSLGAIQTTVAGGLGGYQMAWYKDGTLLPNETEENIYNLGPGVYQLIVTDKGQCQVAIEEVMIISDISNLELAKRILISPNPTSGNLTVEYNLRASSQTQIEIYDYLGRAILRLPPKERRNGQDSFDLSNQPAGVYLIKVSVNDQFFSQKIILAH